MIVIFSREFNNERESGVSTNPGGRVDHGVAMSTRWIRVAVSSKLLFVSIPEITADVVTFEILHPNLAQEDCETARVGCGKPSQHPLSMCSCVRPTTLALATPVRK